MSKITEIQSSKLLVSSTPPILFGVVTRNTPNCGSWPKTNWFHSKLQTCQQAMFQMHWWAKWWRTWLWQSKTKTLKGLNYTEFAMNHRKVFVIPGPSWTSGHLQTTELSISYSPCNSFLWSKRCVKLTHNLPLPAVLNGECFPGTQ